MNEKDQPIEEAVVTIRCLCAVPEEVEALLAEIAEQEDEKID